MRPLKNFEQKAGSEDNKRTGILSFTLSWKRSNGNSGNTGTRLLESGAINKSLFVLGQV
jgi:hypothetical protein